MKKVLVILLLLFLAASSYAGDTGTYNIDDYRINLEPQSDGKVLIDYYQKWSVTGGHIPWITIGMPNDNFAITKSSGAISKIASANEGGWSGVRIDLDRDYKPGESFEVNFSTIQNKLFYADEKNYKLDFTPGWYDRAFTDQLTVSIHFFAQIKSVRANPAPSSIDDETMTWQRSKLGKGEKLSVSISFPKKTIKAAIPEDNLKSEGLPGWAIFLIVVVIIVVVVFILGYLSSDGSDGYSGGGIFFGGAGGSSGRGSGGGGGFGGRSSGCACACVSCACACACAGGGGAGCSRKTKHSCPICKEKGGK
ncbi:MAG: hypothetical protein WCV58_03640 [Patescibacteria group bacterium]